MFRLLLPILMSTMLLYSFRPANVQDIAYATRHENTKFLYKIGNGTARDINFYLSADSIRWNQLTVEPGYQAKEYYDHDKMYFKVYTNAHVFATYRIKGNETYKIYFNPALNKFDLAYFIPYVISF